MGIVQDNKPFLMFLLRFALSYIVLSGIYWLYLSQFNPAEMQTDGITHEVARESSVMVCWLGDASHTAPHSRDAADKLYVNGKYIARVVEGCNAVSVMILFAAFIVAFYVDVKRTVLYIVSGLVIIHVLNIFRIALIAKAGYYYPQYWNFLHDILFPAFIYGVVFVLWVFWVLKIYTNAKKTTA
ncbi:exosortase family protein XrtF [Flavobacterium sp. RNTU_13]|uniref:exosortase family protein XrtF n=1 Tax=Flavobacterium sp. RNTU_13 TaxID=3375145 RepID=UPI0039877978